MPESKYPYNPNHPIGTCGDCGGEMKYNVPRMGPDGGFVHKETGQASCGPQVLPEIIFHRSQIQPQQ